MSNEIPSNQDDEKPQSGIYRDPRSGIEIIYAQSEPRLTPSELFRMTFDLDAELGEALADGRMIEVKGTVGYDVIPNPNYGKPEDAERIEAAKKAKEISRGLEFARFTQEQQAEGIREEGDSVKASGNAPELAALTPLNKWVMDNGVGYFAGHIEEETGDIVIDDASH